GEPAAPERDAARGRAARARDRRREGHALARGDGVGRRVHAAGDRAGTARAAGGRRRGAAARRADRGNALHAELHRRIARFGRADIGSRAVEVVVEVGDARGLIVARRARDELVAVPDVAKDVERADGGQRARDPRARVVHVVTPHAHVVVSALDLEAVVPGVLDDVAVDVAVAVRPAGGRVVVLAAHAVV